MCNDLIKFITLKFTYKNLKQGESILNTYIFLHTFLFIAKTNITAKINLIE